MRSNVRSFDWGLTTHATLYPFWGRFKSFSQIEARLARLATSGELPLVIYAWALGLVALGAVTLLIWSGENVGAVWAVAALAAAAAVAERGTVRLSSSVEVSVAVLPMLFAAVVFGPLASLVVSAASMLGDFRRPYLKWAIYTSSRALTGAASGLVAASLAKLPATDAGAIALATAGGALVMELLDVTFVSTTIKLRRSGSFMDGVRTLGPVFAAALPFHMPVVAMLAFAYTKMSPLSLPLFLAPAIAAQRFFVLYQKQRQLTEDVLAANLQLEEANLSFATALVATLDARDRYTAGHSAAVAIYARDIATALGLREQDQRLAHLAGLVHDVGKVGLPPGLLEKPGPLLRHERLQMQAHAEIGQRILANVDDYTEVAYIIRHHHERFDGGGYPDRLAGTSIPLLSRILAVADAYNAMTSERPYRAAMSSQMARLRLRQGAGTQFDTSIVAAFDAVLADAPETYRTATRSDFMFNAGGESRHETRLAGVA
jgi:putative nucleotidyltransferase with HDIG domain